MNDTSKIPLSSVAPDIQALIQAFRENGEVSYQSTGYLEARERYTSKTETEILPGLDVPVVRDHEVPVKGGSILVREYRSEANQHSPAILFMHGGGWVLGNLQTHDSICRLLTRDCKYAVFAVDYRLAPEHPFPTPVEDCSAALSWLFTNAEKLGVDKHRIGLAGDSAGGNLAAILANTDELRPKGCELRVQAIFYPCTDLRCVTASYQRIVSGFPLTAESVYWFRSLYVPLGTALENPQLSPLLAPRLSKIPLFILTCGFDPLVDEGVAYAERAINEGVRVEHQHLPTHPHGILTFPGPIGSARKMIAQAARFIQEYL